MRNIWDNPIIYKKGAEEHMKRMKDNTQTEEDIDNRIWLMQDFVAFLEQEHKKKNNK